MAQNQGLYQPVSVNSSDDDIKELLDPDVISLQDYLKKRSFLQKWNMHLLFIQMLILMISIVINIYQHSYKPSLEHSSGGSPECVLTDQLCSKFMSPYSPVIDLDLIQYEWVTINGTFHAESEWRGPPTYEREIAWDKLWRRHAIDIPADKIHLLDKNPSEVEFMHTPEDKGGGYAAMLEVHHQLHCLTMLRQFAYKDVYITEMMELPEGFHAEEDLVYAHLDHCIEILRMNLMCTSDVTPVLILVDDKYPAGHILDFSTKHHCRNFDAITAWSDAHVAIQ